MAIKRTSHSVYDTSYHLVWCPKYRKKIFQREFPGLKKKLWSGEMWEDGYFARTIGDRRTSDVIQKYIKSHRDLEQGPAQLGLKLR